MLYTLVRQFGTGINPKPSPMSGAPLQPLAPNVWAANRQIHYIFGFSLPLRMTVVRLPDGALWLYSPIYLDEPTRLALDALGPVKYLVIPNRHHHTFVGGYLQAYPHAALYGPPGLAKAAPQLPLTGEVTEGNRYPWSDQLDSIVASLAEGFREVDFFHPGTGTLILCDLAVNIHHAPPVEEMLLRLAGALGHFGPAGFEKNLAAKSQAEIQRILAGVSTWNIQRIVMAHGEIVIRDAKKTFIQAFQTAARLSV